jgi:hypothetical protein
MPAPTHGTHAVTGTIADSGKTLKSQGPNPKKQIKKRLLFLRSFVSLVSVCFFFLSFFGVRPSQENQGNYKQNCFLFCFCFGLGPCRGALELSVTHLVTFMVFRT